jgi:5'-phosphate synthase pdxT subunit
MTRIGILALQGAFIEHEKALQALGAETVQVRLPEHLNNLDGLVIPGGESTVIGKLATEYKLIDPLRTFAQSKPTWGTCAGLIFLAKDIGFQSQPILGVMDVTVNRNAFGRQVDSFITPLKIKDISDDVPFPAIFIRAPLVTQADANVDVLAQLPDGGIVAARQGHLLGTSFHPELTDDLRVHQYFYDMVQAKI